MAVTALETFHHARAEAGVIKRVEARLVRMPLRVTASFATRAVRTRDYVLVKVISKDGIGLGYTYAGNSGGSIALDAVTTLLAP